MTQAELDHIKTLSGKQLFADMLWAYKKDRRDILMAGLERARELSPNKYGDWSEAKAKFKLMIFPTWGNKTQSQMIRIDGYPCEIAKEVDSTMQIKFQYMSLMNPLANSCVFRSFIKNGEVQFL